MTIQIIPSLAAAPLHNLSHLLKLLEDSGIDTIHFDIEDGNFVPMLTLGMKILQDLRPITKMKFDVHLMVNDPEWLIPELYKIGVEAISFHYEASLYPRRILKLISEYQIEAGLAFNPATPIPDINFCLPYLKFILVLSTEPELNSSSHLSSVLEKVKYYKENATLLNLKLIVDGGVDMSNIMRVIEAGADKVIVGRAIFKDQFVKKNINEIKKAAGLIQS